MANGQWNMKKSLITIIITFSLGFLTHAFFFPDVLTNGITDVKNIIIPNSGSTANSQTNNPLFTEITFDGERFSRHNITIGYTQYIRIVNTSDSKLMELVGSTNALTTNRGYGESEALQMQFNQKGQFAVVDKNNTEEKLVITVK